MSKLDKSIDWGETSLLTDSVEADAIGKDGNRYKITPLIKKLS